MKKGYVEFIADLKQRIVQSRYAAARLANREQLVLYLRTGRMLAEKIAAEKWGAAVIEQIAKDPAKTVAWVERVFSPEFAVNEEVSR